MFRRLRKKRGRRAAEAQFLVRSAPLPQEESSSQAPAAEPAVTGFTAKDATDATTKKQIGAQLAKEEPADRDTIEESGNGTK